MDETSSMSTLPGGTPAGAFIDWTRADYYFSVSVDAKDAKEILDQFMEAFPY